ncbi:hypothetical protein [Nocardioides speluncae]|uniref:hypothetical protein n=1 Tax=Nocardioides speluncae TaxID=2670337 RepID=UPI000D68A2BE|nr:hypothetical protein [Nocardioides speluncae]
MAQDREQQVLTGLYEPPGRREEKRHLLRLSFLPWMLALYLFTPRYRLGKPDPVVEGAHRWRTILAIAIGVLATIPYLAGPADAEKVYNGVVGDGFTTAAAAIPLFLIACGILVWAAGPHWRPATIRQLLRPLAALGALVLIFGFWVLMIVLVLADSNGQAYEDWGPAAKAAFIIPMLWFIPLLLVSTWLILRHLFNAVDGHPLLPPLFITLVAWWAVLQKLILTSDLRPLLLDVGLGIGGALTLTALSAWEVSRLAGRGVTLRSGPFPTWDPPPPPPPPGPPMQYGGQYNQHGQPPPPYRR